MNPIKIAQIQTILGVTPDGIWGPKSKLAFEAVLVPSPVEGVLRGTLPGWEFIKARIDGHDIVIEDAIVTAFGGATDKMDSGETASGISTKQNPDFRGCALPMRRNASPHLAGSPIPALPWRTAVIFTDPKTGRKVETQLIDEGPAKWTGHAGDLTVAAARVFDPAATANRADIPELTIRIVGGAAYT